jgi:hypothetical protein
MSLRRGDDKLVIKPQLDIIMSPYLYFTLTSGVEKPPLGHL